MDLPLGLLLLADSRLPAGGHGHSGGMEALVDRGLLVSVETLGPVLAARVRTTGAVPAGAAAAACALAATSSAPPWPPPVEQSHHHPGRVDEGGFARLPGDEGGFHQPARHAGRPRWGVWDAAVSARMPSAALRAASRAQGAALLRTAEQAWPGPTVAALRKLGRVHHAVVLGVATACAGGRPEHAAALAVHHLIGGACTAAVRLLGLDPLRVAALAAATGRTAEPLVDSATRAALAAVAADDPTLLPADGNPTADVLAELHHRSEATLFAS